MKQSESLLEALADKMLILCFLLCAVGLILSVFQLHQYQKCLKINFDSITCEKYKDF